MNGLWLVAAFLVVTLAFAVDQPFWGCGILGPMPGIKKDGSVSVDMQRLIDGLKVTNRKDGKVTYWNWDYAPQQDASASGGGSQVLTKDFLFMPENWGVGAVSSQKLVEAGATGFPLSDNTTCPGTMADIFLGANEPDIYGSCMGGMMGRCTAPCSPADVAAKDCPVCHLYAAQGSEQPNSKGRCNCYSDSHPTSVGYWTVPNVTSVYQPLPTCWDHADCVEVVMNNWKEGAAIVAAKGYKYLSTPLVAVDMIWLRKFITKACDGCSAISCGCPTHIGWHFYANDCQPEKGGYDAFQAKLNDTVSLMEDFPHLQGAIINEVGMLNCAMDTPDAICIPNGPDQTYPALEQQNHACPSTPNLPKGLASFAEELLKMVSKAKTSDGRRAVASFTWFNLDMSGGTYNLQLFDNETLNELGEQYITSCQAWASDSQPWVKLFV